MQIAKTADSSLTLFSSEAGEHYHSVGEGALRETYEKHIRPAFGIVKAAEQKSVRVLDVCFGLGYNTLCSVMELIRLGFEGKCEIAAPELDRQLIASLNDFCHPNEIKEVDHIKRSLIKTLRYEDEKFKIEIVTKDAAEYVKNTKRRFDIVYHDPFSIMKNPSLWSGEYFASLFNLLEDSGVVTTYSASAKARQNMRHAGFLLYAHPFAADSGLRSGTIAVKTALDGGLRQV
ncbi:MAG: hypothetical protein LBE89_06675 [Helicobacteraceae bacterium]|jgi:tRNA U34 5-methylaminomethyl-2-thiouridine-forming methyltransferase MnmC|nr:hypothetical protein [Helicobacteraceae bacterium]